jgi:hypothetical protein
MPVNISPILSLVFCLSLFLCFSCTSTPPEKTQRDFSTQIPAETSYVAQFQVDTSSPTVRAWAKGISDRRESYRVTARDNLTLTFFTWLVSDLSEHIEKRSTEDIGIPTSFSVALYGHWLWPVYTQEIKDQALFIRWIKEILNANDELKKSELIRQTKGKHTVYTFDLRRSDLSLIIYFPDEHTVKISLIYGELEADLVAYLTGDKKPQRFLSESKHLKDLVDYAGIKRESALIWVSFERIFQAIFSPKGINADLIPSLLVQSIERDRQKESQRVCQTEFKSLIAKAPEFIVGDVATSKSQDQHVRILWNLQDEISRELKKMGTQDIVRIQPQDQMLGASMAVNLSTVVSAVQKLISAVIQSPYQCRDITRILNLNELSKAQTQLSFIPPIFLGIKGISLSVQDFKFNLVKPDIAATIVISAQQAPMLIQMAKMFVPSLASLKLPETGAPPQLIQGLSIPANFQPVYLQIQRDALGLALGEQGKLALVSALEDERSKSAPLIRLNYNAQKFDRAFAETAPSQGKSSAQVAHPVNISVDVDLSSKGLIIDGFIRDTNTK